MPPRSTELVPTGAGGSPAPTNHKTHWHSRGYLPHYDHPGQIQMITFRLADALPANALMQLQEELRGREDARRRQRFETLLDAGHGACHLRNLRIAKITETALLYFDGVRYRLLAWVVMPNHVHLLMETISGATMAQIVHSWKSFTAKKANELLGQRGQFWQKDYFDRAIRDERHFKSAVEYIHNNPVKAGLVSVAEEWAFSSAVTWGRETKTG